MNYIKSKTGIGIPVKKIVIDQTIPSPIAEHELYNDFINY